MIYEGVPTDAHEQIERAPKAILRIETSEQRSSLYHPVRKKILESLASGILDHKIETDTREETLADGTGVTHLVSRKTPFRRYWMTVIEILDSIKAQYPKTSITKHRCYYHVQKLVELGLVEQYPPSTYDELGKKRRTRGRQFRSTAKFFISCFAKHTPNAADLIFSLLRKNQEAEPSADDKALLNDLLRKQDEAIINMMENIASDITITAAEFSLMPSLLEQTALIMLSDNPSFIRRYNEAREILVGSSELTRKTDSMKSMIEGDDIT
jgi:hypothetical protein